MLLLLGQMSVQWLLQAEVGDAQMVSNSLGPFLTLASAARAAAGGAGIGEAAPVGGSATAPSGTGSGDSRPAGTLFNHLNRS